MPDSPPAPRSPPVPWRKLDAARQLALREAYAEEMARRGTTCSLDEKIARFAAWLAPQGIAFDAADLPGRRQPDPAPSSERKYPGG